MNSVILLTILSITFVLGGYAHELDLIRHCVEDNTLHTWSGEYKFSCVAERLQDE